MGSRNLSSEIAFARDEADRRVAGVAAAARVVRAMAEAGADRIVLSAPGGSLAENTWEDIHRVAPAATVEVVDRPGLPAAPRLTARGVLRGTGKPSDGPVSRWLNRPISRAISAVLLLIPGVRPLHASMGTAVIAAAMFVALLSGGVGGLIVGGCLFQAASVFDGCDGEIARATFRTSRLGALLDGVIDIATNFLFILGVAINLSQDTAAAAALGAWGLLLFLIGLAALSRSAASADKPFSLDLVKDRYRARFSGPALQRIMRFLTIVSSRDFFAVLFPVLIIVGLPMAVLYIFAMAATVWIVFVLGGLPRRERHPELEARVE